MTLNAYSKTMIIYCRNLDFPSKNAGQPSSRIQQGRPRSVRPGRLLREAGHSPEPGQGLPAPCLARQETVLQPHRLRPSLVQVRNTYHTSTTSTNTPSEGLTGAGTTSTVSPRTVGSLLLSRCLLASLPSSTS